MLKKLKECKTLKEIFACIGTKPFEIAALLVIVAWCVLPVYFIVERLFWSVNAVNDFQHSFAISEGHLWIVNTMGSVSVYVAVFYLISRVAVYGKGVFKKIKEEPWHFLLLAMLLWACLATVQAENIELAYYGDNYLAEGLRNYFYYAAIYICAFGIVTPKYKWRVLNIFNVIAMIISLIVIVVDFVDIPILEKSFPAARAAVFYHFNHAGYYINLGIVCAMGLYMHTKSKIGNWLYAFCIAFQVYGILVNSTLASFIGSCCAMIMILIMFVRKNQKASLKMLTPVMIVIVLIIASYFGYVPTSSGEDMRVNFETLFKDGQALAEGSDAIDSIGHGRMTLWKQGLKMIARKPVFGYGPEHLDAELSEIMWVSRPDNEFIQYGVFLGVPAVLFYIASLIWLFIHQWGRMKALDRNILIAAGCVIAYMVSCQFGVTAFYTTPFLFIFWGMAAGRTPDKQEQIDNELLKMKTQTDAVLEKRLLEPKKKKKNKKNK